MADPRPHYGRTRIFKDVRIVAWRNRKGSWFEVENIDGEMLRRYPSALTVERARAIVIAGSIEIKMGEEWVWSSETKYITSHTPFTKKHTIDDFADGAEDRYSWRFQKK